MPAKSSPRGSIAETGPDRRESEFSTSSSSSHADENTRLLKSKRSSISSSESTFESPYGKSTKSSRVRGLAKKIQVYCARFQQWWFKTAYGICKAPFRNVQSVTDFDQILTLFSFCFVNLLPVHIFSLTMCMDYHILVNVLGVATQAAWQDALWYVTWFFVGCYTLNVCRLIATLLMDNQAHLRWIDWEEGVYARLRPNVISVIKSASDIVWENFHEKTWTYIRGIQRENEVKERVVREVAREMDLPDLVENCLVEFSTVKGCKELDYRWYLHDNRKNSPYLREMKYELRETIASFLIHQEAFDLTKDDIVDLYCE